MANVFRRLPSGRLQSSSLYKGGKYEAAYKIAGEFFIWSTARISIRASTQVNRASSASVAQVSSTKLIGVAGSTQLNHAASAQVHRISAHRVRVDTSPLISGKVVIGDPGLGLLAEEIAAQTASGDNGAGLLYNESIDAANAGKELRAYVANWPSAGSLFIDENGIVTWSSLPDGAYAFSYEVFANGISLGTATFRAQVGPHKLTVSSSQQANQLASGAVSQGAGQKNITLASSQQAIQASSLAIKQTHRIGVANSIQAQQVGSTSIQQTRRLTVANSTQANQAASAVARQTHRLTIAGSNQASQLSSGVIKQTHAVRGANSQVANQAAGSSISQAHKVLASNSVGVNQGASVSIAQDSTHRIGVASSRQAIQSSSVSIRQTHRLVAAPVAVDQVAVQSAIVQTHLIIAANVQQAIKAAPVALLGAQPFTQAQLDFLLAYLQENLMVPTAEQIAAAVLAALNTTTIPVDAKKMNGAPIIGDGTEANTWRGVGVSP